MFYIADDTRPPLSDAVATSSDDREQLADDTGSDDNDDVDAGDASSLMLAENMESQQQQQQQHQQQLLQQLPEQQKLRAKRDLDADQIRELFESSQNARDDDNYEPGELAVSPSHILAA